MWEEAGLLLMLSLWDGKVSVQCITQVGYFVVKVCDTATTTATTASRYILLVR